MRGAADYPVICDRCGLRYQRSECRTEWTGWLVCNECHEAKHPQLDLKSFADKQSVPDARPRQPMCFRDIRDNSISKPMKMGETKIKQYDPDDR